MRPAIISPLFSEFVFYFLLFVLQAPKCKFSYRFIYQFFYVLNLCLTEAKPAFLQVVCSPFLSQQLIYPSIILLLELESTSLLISDSGSRPDGSFPEFTVISKSFTRPRIDTG